uniref:Uncharacterized protein n=1 Tax=Rangifer tarandus platyrhynchus TaxID=3082113 RepID=A0ACB0F4S0_RANTA|nr:unnamed protein product [Rangifer tarandus platyrhynchus]
MTVYYLLFALLFLFLLPVSALGNDRAEWIENLSFRYYCKRRSGRCALIGYLPKEEQIGRCALSGRKCCRKKK